MTVITLEAKEAVTPAGKPEAAKATVPLKPFCGVTVIVDVPLVPCEIARMLGEAERVKFAVAAALTARLRVVVCVKLPEVPVMVTVEVPVVAVLLAVRVMTPEELKDAVTPEGKPEAENATVPLKPFTGVTLIVLVPLAPCASVRLLGLAEREKSAAAAGVPHPATIFSKAR